MAWVSRYDRTIDAARAVAASPDGSRVFVTGGSGTAGGADPTAGAIVTIAYDASTGATLWRGSYRGAAGDRGNAVAVSLDGTEVVVAGEATPEGADDTAYATIAYDGATGAQLWARSYGGTATGDDVATSVVVTPSGVVVVTGTSNGRNYGDYATIAYDADTGRKRWVRRYNGPGNFEDDATSIALTAGGTAAVVTGWSDGGDYATIAYDTSTGDQLWIRRYDRGGSFDRAWAVAATDDTVVVTGSSEAGAPTYSDYATVAYDSSTGETRWTARYHGPGSADDGASDVAISPDGANVFVTGHSPSEGAFNSDYATIGYEMASGRRLWVARYNASGVSEDYAKAIVTSPDGRTVFVTGSSYRSASSDTDFFTIAYDSSTGDALWIRRYNGPANSWDDPSAITTAIGGAVTPDLTLVFVTGASVGASGDYDYATVAFKG